MTPTQLRRARGRLTEFLEYCFTGLGRSERREALASYLRGLLLDGERKSMVPVAARIAENQSETEAIRQRLQQAVAVAQWDEGEVFARVARRAEKVLPDIDAYVIDDTGFPKKGKHSVGVQRQYSGTLGRIDNCQIATSLHLASKHGGVCIGARLYLPKEWAQDRGRCKKAGIPADVKYAPKWRLALDLLGHSLEDNPPKRVVLADAAYGCVGDFRRALRDRDLQYVVGVKGTEVVWPPGERPEPPPPRTKPGPTPKKWRDGNATAMSISALASSLPPSAWRKTTWETGSKGRKAGRFAAIHIRTAHRHGVGKPPGIKQWLLCEWSASKDKPEKFFLSNLPANTSKRRLVYLAKLRWRIERDYQEMKGELGLDHFEGRGWRGFHHHFACVAAAHAFLTMERVIFPPER